ncbi:MAG: MATE family efflux transporter [Lachnospiraceae bacterium]|jgi:putative MATE family efflux protein|nr:MATE family efflux transporter [Lachnospiraceae bacterium]
MNELFEKKSIPSAYLTLAIPVVLSMVVQLVYNMVDTYFISQTNNTALIAGVSVCTPLFTLMLAVGDFFALGGSSVMSRLLGAGQLEKSKRISTFSIYASLAFGLLVTLIMLLFQQPILGLLGADETTWTYATAYYRWLVLGAPVIIFSLMPSNLLRTVGKPNAGMVITILGAVINMVLDPVFIFGLGLGAAGAAIATVIGYICSAVAAILYIALKCDELSFDIRNLFFKDDETGTGADIQSVFAIGLPASITNLMQTLGIMLTNRALRTYGSDSIAMMGIVLKIVNVAMLVIVGLAFGGQPLTGYCYGSGNMSRLKKVLKFAYLLIAGTAAVLAALLMAFAVPLVSIFVEAPELIAQGVQMLRLQMPGMVFMGICLVTICTFQSTGKGLPSFLLSICRQGVVFAIVLFVMKYALGYMGVISAQFVTDAITAVIAYVLFRLFLWPDLKEEKRRC